MIDSCLTMCYGLRTVSFLSYIADVVEAIVDLILTHKRLKNGFSA